MTERELPADKDIVRRLAVDAFNHAWTLMDQEEPRAVHQDFELIHTTHASRHLWAFVGEPVNLARGEWQVSRVYAVLGRAEPALVHGRRCLEILEEEGIGDWDLGFAHEALARAFIVAGDIDNAKKHLEEAHRVAETIKEDEDRQVLLGDLKTIEL